jgi:hypothetical protein
MLNARCCRAFACRRLSSAQASSALPNECVAKWEGEMPAKKIIAFTPEQIQWVKDLINAQLYGESISDEAVSRILKEVGTEHVPPDLDLEQLKTDIYAAWCLYSDYAQSTICKILSIIGVRSQLFPSPLVMLRDVFA